MYMRDYKNFEEGECYHVFNRGVGKIDIFRNPDDYDLFAFRLREALFPEARKRSSDISYHRKLLPPGAFTLICYCLMPNHFHLVLRQNTSVPISVLMLAVAGGYAKCFNKKYKRVGSLYQDQFKAVHIDTNEQLLWLSAYVHQNPRVADYVENLSHWEPSSYFDYIGKRGGTLCDTTPILEQFRSASEYEQFIDDSYELIRDRTDIAKSLIDSEDW